MALQDLVQLLENLPQQQQEGLGLENMLIQLQEMMERLQKRKRKIQPIMTVIQNMSPEELRVRGIEGPAQLQDMIESGILQDSIEEVK